MSATPMGSVKPVLAIVGRPNVGKSTLYNRLVGRRAAIVEDFPGVTRDRQYGDALVLGREFICIDTGGFEPETDDALLIEMRGQAEIAISEADSVLVIFDGRSGLLPSDIDITRMLQRTDKTVHYAVNKVDGDRHEGMVADFYALGVETIWTISALHGAGVLDMMEAVTATLPDTLQDAAFDRDDVVRVAVIGKPNAGKSTLVNRLLGEERLVVSAIPGTTRDSIDTWLDRPADPEVAKRAEAAVTAAMAALREAGIDVDEEHFDPKKARARAIADARAASKVKQGPDLEYVWEAPDDDEDDAPDGPVLVAGDMVPERLFIGEETMSRTWKADLESSDDVYENELWRNLDEALRAREMAAEPSHYLVIDTAGVRRRKWIKTLVERFSVVRAFKSIDRAAVCLLMVDANMGATDQDARLAGLIEAKGRACVILINKWDVKKEKDTNTSGAMVHQLRDDLKAVTHAPIIFISAKTGQRTQRILQEVDRVYHNARRRISTPELNRYLARVIERQPPPLRKGRRLKIYYTSQVSVCPPTFLLSVNEKKHMHFSYRRFLLNKMRAEWDFDGTPIRFILRERKAEKGRRRHDGSKS